MKNKHLLNFFLNVYLVDEASHRRAMKNEKKF